MADIIKKIKIPTPYKQGNNYYFKITINKVRKTYPTGMTTLEEAEKYVKKFMLELDEYNVPDVSSRPTLQNVITQYQSEHTNPKYQEVQSTQGNYTSGRAKSVARAAKYMLETLPKPLLKKKISVLTRQDCIQVRDSIHRAYGSTAKANETWKAFKTMLTYASEKGLTPGQSPAYGLSDIKYKKKIKHAVAIEDIMEILKHGELFFNEYERLFFLTIATTGMRKSEALALNAEQFRVSKGIPILTINRAAKSYEGFKVSEPKWGVVRTIPLPQILWRELHVYVEKGGDIFASLPVNSINDMYDRIKAIAPTFDDMETPEYVAELTSHVLRHSLNSALLIEGVSEYLVAEYFAWRHQTRTVQEGYTHVYARNLLPVAEGIDRLFDYYDENIFDIKQKSIKRF